MRAVVLPSSGKKQYNRGMLLLSLLGLTAGSASAGTMPPGSFLRRPAPDAAALNRALRTDSRVSERYARVFRQSPKALRKAFAEMRLTRLTHDRILRVYYVHAGETLGYRVRRVRRGTPVYALRDGTPVLAQVCGNPLRSTLSVPELLLPPQQTARIPVFMPNEPLPPLQTSGLTLTFGPMRSAMPPTALTGQTTPEPPVTADLPGGGGGGSTGKPALPSERFALLAAFPAALPSALLSSLLPMILTRRATDIPHNDFQIAQDVAPGRNLPILQEPIPALPPAGSPPSPGSNPAAPTPPSPTEAIRDWTQEPESPPVSPGITGELPARYPLPTPSYSAPDVTGSAPNSPSGNSGAPGGDTPFLPEDFFPRPSERIPESAAPSVAEPSFLALAIAALTSGSLMVRRRTVRPYRETR